MCGWRWRPTMSKFSRHLKGTRGSIFASIHVEHFYKERPLSWKENIVPLSSQLQHENEVWNSPQFLDTRSSQHRGMKGFTLSVHQSSFSLHEREDLLRQDISFSLQRLLILLLNCIQGFYCLVFICQLFSLPNHFPFTHSSLTDTTQCLRLDNLPQWS